MHTTRAVAIGCCMLFFLTGTGNVFAQDGTEQNLIKGLTPTAVSTRSITSSDASDTSPADRQFLNSLPTRGISVEAREKVQDIAVASKLPRVEINLEFDYDSVILRPASLPMLYSLGKALNDPALQHFRMMIAGYTDAAGAEDYNQKLSERRAGSVEEYLETHFSVPSNRLVTVGFGETHLKDPSNSLASENRRVEIINLSAD